MQRLKQKAKNKKSNNSFLNGEKYKPLIQEIFRLKRGERKKESRGYQLIQRYGYDVV